MLTTVLELLCLQSNAGWFLNWSHRVWKKQRFSKLGTFRGWRWGSFTLYNFKLLMLVELCNIQNNAEPFLFLLCAKFRLLKSYILKSILKRYILAAEKHLESRLRRRKAVHSAGGKRSDGG